MKWFGVSAQLQLLNANAARSEHMEWHQRLWWEDRINTEVKSAPLGGEPQSGTGIPQDYNSPDQTEQLQEPSSHRGAPYLPRKAQAREGFSLPTLISAPSWLDDVAKFANKMLTCKTKLSENQYQIIARALLEDKLNLRIMYLQF